MSVLASFAARGREHWLNDQTSARDHSGGRVRKARGRLAALGAPALEAVWHRRQEELCDRNVGGLWWGIDGNLDDWLSGRSSGAWLSEPVQETGTTGLGMWSMWVSEPVRTWSLESGLSVWEKGHTLRAGSVGTFRPTIKQQGLAPTAACTSCSSGVVLTFFTVSANDFRRQKDVLTFFAVSADDFRRYKDLLTFLTISADHFRRPKDLLTFVAVRADDCFRQKDLQSMQGVQSPGLAPADACLASSRQSVQCVQSPGLAPADASVASSRQGAVCAVTRTGTC
jgi:hypothetical protein